MRTLILGDIHEHTAFADRILRRFAGRYDQVILLGDYLDAFSTSPDSLRTTCRWLVESLQYPNRIHLLGNHDMPYFAPANPQLECPGWTQERQEIFDTECADLDRDRLHLAVAVGPWLFSHAGFSPAVAQGRTAEHLVEAARRAKLRAFAGIPSHLLGRSPARGFPGDNEVPGATWMDFGEEFVPVRPLHQIVGHTHAGGTARGKILRSKDGVENFEFFGARDLLPRLQLPQPFQPGNYSCNYCLDCLENMAGYIDEEGWLQLLPTAGI